MEWAVLQEAAVNIIIGKLICITQHCNHSTAPLSQFVHYPSALCTGTYVRIWYCVFAEGVFALTFGVFV